jgi:GntR family transcriptional regulator/MocR family aminotransferase
MLLSLDKKGTLYDQIARAIRSALLEGRIVAGDRLPSTRTLATALGVLHSFDLPGAAATFSQGINNEGRLVGRYATPDGVPHGFISGTIAAASCL